MYRLILLIITLLQALVFTKASFQVLTKDATFRPGKSLVLMDKLEEKSTYSIFFDSIKGEKNGF